MIKKKYELPKAFLKKWLKALRSGKYQQGKSSLRIADYDYDSNKSFFLYCCLGVGCEVSGAIPIHCGFISKESQKCLSN
jgi:hypothetical protein